MLNISFLEERNKKGIDVIVTSTYRDHESQAYLYAIGRSEFGREVTKAKPGYSFHNYKVAFDFVPVKNGKAQWGDIRLIEKCGNIAEECGLE